MLQGEPARLRAGGKFFREGGETVFLRAVSYGPFPPDEDGRQLPTGTSLERDLEAIDALGADTLRLHEVPDLSFVEACHERGIRLFVSIPWAQHVDFLADAEVADEARARVERAARQWSQHPAVAGFLIGNEIPAPLVRWMNPGRVSRFLEELIQRGRRHAPETLFGYANYPSTEYLQPRNADFCAFNIYLEERERFGAYLQRLQVLAHDKPLLISEFGLDSRRHGEARQAEVLDWHLSEAGRHGAAGSTVFAFSDRWYRGGRRIEDWDFGLVDREGEPKPSFAAVSRRWRDVRRPTDLCDSAETPGVSVIVCTYRGAVRLRSCLDSLRRLRYPNYEVVVVNDGDDGAVRDLVRGYPEVRLLTQPHRGLSAARNLGAAEARHGILAYTDDDCEADPDWLNYLARAFEDGDWAASGGPNVPPRPVSPKAAWLSAAPGGPAHVLLDDREAEHLPGCNLAVRKDALEHIGGFDVRFRTAGDDVDFCWRLREAGFRIGFEPAAMVWHHRRPSIGAYLRQQRGYGAAEALLMKKHPERFGRGGGARWGGVVYQSGVNGGAAEGAVIYQGARGEAPFQRIYGNTHLGWETCLLSLPWVCWGFVAILAGLTGKGLGVLTAVGGLMLAGTLMAALHFGSRVSLAPDFCGVRDRLAVACLGVLQPWVRGATRARYSLPRIRWPFPPLPRGRLGWAQGLARTDRRYWSAEGIDRHALLESLRARLQQTGARFSEGDGFESWDLEVEGGLLSRATCRTVTEYHGGKDCLTRVRVEMRRVRGAGLVWGLAMVAALAASWWVAALVVLVLLLEPQRGRYQLLDQIGGAARDVGLDELAETRHVALRSPTPPS